MDSQEVVKNLNELQIIVNKFSEQLYKKHDYEKAKRMEVYSVSIFHAVGIINEAY
jgi:hypothetical protein